MNVGVELDVLFESFDAAVETSTVSLMGSFPALDSGDETVGDAPKGNGVDVFMSSEGVLSRGGGDRWCRWGNRERDVVCDDGRRGRDVGHVVRDLRHCLVVMMLKYWSA